MITRTEAERLAAGINALRPDWPIPQLMTLIGELHTWPLLDLGVGLAHIALEQNIDGTWRTKSPYRVKEQGPWRTIGISNAEIEATRRRDETDRQQRIADARILRQAIAECDLCDARGYIPNGQICAHDPDLPARYHANAERARQALNTRSRP